MVETAANPVNIVLSGLGGQGILFMTKLLAQASLAKGFEVMGAETHGMAQRGGSVVSHLRLGPVHSSLVPEGKAHFLLALDESEGYRTLPFLRPAGRLYLDAPSSSIRPEVQAYLDRLGAVCRAFPAQKTAMDLGAPLSTNLALLGFFSAFESAPIGHAELRATVEAASPERLKDANLSVFDAGYLKGLESYA